MSLPGIGRWSAEYALLRGLGRLGVLPGDDVGARDNLRRYFERPTSAGYDEVSALAKSWWPYGGLVYFHLLLDALSRGGHLETVSADLPAHSSTSRATTVQPGSRSSVRANRTRAGDLT